MTTAIRSRWDSSKVLYKGEGTLSQVVEAAIKAGANLGGADLGGADLTCANLTGGNLARSNLTDANLTDANLTDANLALADLTDADLAGANLAGAYLEGTNLEGADLGGAGLARLARARNVPSDTEQTRAVTPQDYAKRAARYRDRNPDVPVVPQIDLKIRDVLDTGKGFLDMAQWHLCETTHCRAGWAITLAGEAGRRLEKECGAQMAAWKIYRASTGRVPSFFAPDDVALEDIRARAEEQAGCCVT